MKFCFAVLLLLSGFLANAKDAMRPGIIVLGIAQDGGYPHAGCTKNCCSTAWAEAGRRRHITSLALLDPETHKWWLFEATPDIAAQLQLFHLNTGGAFNYLPEGIFITHAHIGHYAGLMQFGREVMNTKSMPVYVLPKMKTFLEHNGPWSQLVSLNNIKLVEMTPEKKDTGIQPQILLDSSGITVSAVLVPHRDEFSETAGFRISLRGRKYLFLPDIDKWNKWDRSIISEVSSVDVALLDATFYEDGEILGRNISEVPHPFVSETISLFSWPSVPAAVRSKVYFIHFNHTNPLLWDSRKQEKVRNAGFNLAAQGMIL
jgi:pyrroloquinoline quinone biosynthesis protein B